VQDKVNIFVVAVDQVLIPKTLDLKLGYTLPLANDHQPLSLLNGTRFRARTRVDNIRTPRRTISALMRPPDTGSMTA